MSADLTLDELATLTPEEVAAITGEDEHTPQEIAAMQRIADQASGTDDADDGGSEADNDAMAAAQAADAQAAQIEAAKAEDAEAKSAATDAVTVATDNTAKQDTPQPVYKAELPADFNELVQTLATQESALKQQLKDGDIDFDEFIDLQAVLLEQKQTLNNQKIKVEIATDMAQQNAASSWQATVNRNIESFSKELNGINYLKDEDKQADLDQFVKVLAGKPENNDKSMDWFMQEAHRRVKALHGISSTEPPKPKGTLDEAAARRKQNSASAPKTLAQVPGGDGPGDVEGKFAQIDRLTGEALEQAIASMTPAQRAEYAAA